MVGNCFSLFEDCMRDILRLEVWDGMEAKIVFYMNGMSLR